VYLVIVFLLVILPMLLLSSKLKRNLIVALKINRDDLGGSGTSWIHLGMKGLVSAQQAHISRWIPQSAKEPSGKRQESSSVLRLCQV
jgi:hypothetical protein